MFYIAILMLNLLDPLLIPLRWIHMFSGASWFGLVVLINFILLPAINGAKNQDHVQIIYTQIFTRVFRLASIFSATVVLSGTLMLHVMLAGDWSRLLNTGRWGHSLVLGGGLAWLITIFHFVVESILAKKLGFDPAHDSDAMSKFHVVLTIVPRLAMAVLSMIFLLMMVAARGLPN